MFFKKAKPRAQAPGMPVQQSEASEPSYIGRDTALEGQINCEGELHIDGTFRGTVRRGSASWTCMASSMGTSPVR